MRRCLTYLLAALLLLPASSCRRAVERAAAKIRVEAVEDFRIEGLSGITALLRVNNGSGHKLRLDEAEAQLLLGGSVVATVRLREPVEVARRTTAEVATQWQLRIGDPLTLFALGRRVGQRNFAQLGISYRLTGRGGPAPINISGENVPVSDFLNTFGVTLQDVENWLKQTL